MQTVVPSSQIKAPFYHVRGINASKYVLQIPDGVQLRVLDDVEPLDEVVSSS